MHKLALSLAFLACTVAAHAAPTYTTTTLVPYDPTAGSSNFSSPTLGSNTTPYTVRTGADATNFYVDITANPVAGVNDVSGLQFANVYVGGNTFSGLVFQVTNSQVFTYSNAGPYSLANTGYSFTASNNDIAFAIPFSFFESNTLNIPGFTAASPGDIIRVSYSQSFGYTFVGGSTFYPTANRLGGQTVPNAVPEPGSFALGGLGLLGLGALVYRRRQVAA